MHDIEVHVCTHMEESNVLIFNIKIPFLFINIFTQLTYKIDKVVKRKMCATYSCNITRFETGAHLAYICKL